MQKTFIFFQDPGHGWLKVPRNMLIDLGILNKISAYSYERGGYVYLEEDQDSYIFFKTFVSKFGFKPNISSRHTNRQSKIRGYSSFFPEKKSRILDGRWIERPLFA